jgi:hypothetical protein
LLSALAWATDESDRPHLDLDGVLQVLVEQRLYPAADRGRLRRPVFEGLRRLGAEQVLVADGQAWRFAVPLYRRWVAWQWPPEALRQAGADGARVALSS